MIGGFRCEQTRGIFEGRVSIEFPQTMQKTAKRRLDILAAATSLQDIGMLPGNQLEALKGKRKGQHSIRVNDQWRICFSWRENKAYEVEILDYH